MQTTQWLCKTSQWLSIMEKRDRVSDHMQKDNRKGWTRELTCFRWVVGESRTAGWWLPDTRAKSVSGAALSIRDESLMVKTLPIQTGKHLGAAYGSLNPHYKRGRRLFPKPLLCTPLTQTQPTLDKNEKVQGTLKKLHVLPYAIRAN